MVPSPHPARPSAWNPVNAAPSSSRYRFAVCPYGASGTESAQYSFHCFGPRLGPRLSRSPMTVSMAAKSQATAAWDRRNCDQVTLERVGAGSTPAFLRICQTVDAAIGWPSPASSPWTRRYPQVGFSAARRSVSRRSFAEVDGRPGARQGWVQCRALRRRCQRNSVSGVTSHPARLGRGSAAAIAPSKLRSASVRRQVRHGGVAKVDVSQIGHRRQRRDVLHLAAGDIQVAQFPSAARGNKSAIRAWRSERRRSWLSDARGATLSVRRPSRDRSSSPWSASMPVRVLASSHRSHFRSDASS